MIPLSDLTTLDDQGAALWLRGLVGSNNEEEGAAHGDAGQRQNQRRF